MNLRGAIATLALLLLSQPALLRAQYSERDEPKPQTLIEDFSAEQARKEDVAIRRISLDAQINPQSHEIKAKATITFQAIKDTSIAQFELNGNFFVTKVTGEDGRAIPVRRSGDSLSTELTLGKTLPKGQSATIGFEYAGTLADAEHSPVEGVQLSYIGEEGSYLLYPGRWFPITGYAVDRYTAEMKFTVPQGYQVISGGKSAAPVSTGTSLVYSFTFDKPQFPGSVAIVRTPGKMINADGQSLKVYFSDAHQAMAQPYAEAAAKMINVFSEKFGPPPVANTSIVEIEDHSLGGYAGPETIFLSARAIGTKVNDDLLAQEVAQQWWRGLVSPATRADLWIDHGMATYASALYDESVGGKTALDDRMRQLSIDALTNDTIPVRAAGRLQDFTPQFQSILYDKSAVVLNMLRWVIGDEAFFATMKKFADQYAFKSASTDDFEKLAETVSGTKLGPFFIQWTESTGASDFKADYTVFRVKDGYKITGKIKQDMDTFSMPVEVTVETDAEPVTQRVVVVGRDSEFTLSTKGRPKKIVIDPNNRVLKFNDTIRIQVAVSRGEQAVAAHDFQAALDEYQKALDVNKNSSLAHYRVGEAFFQLRNYQSAANSFRAALNGDLIPKWTEVWCHLNLGKIFDVTGQRDRALNEYQQAVRTKDDTQGALQAANEFLKKPYERQSREMETADSSTTPSTDKSTAEPPAADKSTEPPAEDRPKLRRANYQMEGR